MPGATTKDATASAWAVAWLIAIGAPVTDNNINNVIAWGIAESGQPGHNQGHGGWTNFNPLNVVTQSNDAHTGQGGSQGNIADFGSLNDGVGASARLFLHNPNAAPIINAFRSDADISTVNSAVNQFYGSWGGHISLGGVPAGAGSKSIGSVGDATGNAILTSSGASKLCLPGPLAVCVPNPIGVGAGVFNAASATTALAGDILLMFSNWRYVVEFIVGVGMVLLGIRLIYADLSGNRVLPDVKGAGQTAGTVAMAAAAV